MNYTKYGYRINQITTGASYDWIFLPVDEVWDQSILKQLATSNS